MHFALSHHALHVLGQVTKQLGLPVVHQVVPQAAAERQRSRGGRMECDPVGVASSFAWPEPGIGSGWSLEVSPVLEVAHLPPQGLDDRPLG